MSLPSRTRMCSSFYLQNECVGTIEVVSASKSVGNWLSTHSQKHELDRICWISASYDSLQKRFSETFRRMAVNESDYDLKRRHSHFANMGRLLREFVECFGDSDWMDTDLLKTSFYHGMLNMMQFESTKAVINGPMSITTDYIKIFKSPLRIYMLNICVVFIWLEILWNLIIYQNAHNYTEWNKWKTWVQDAIELYS